MNDTPPSKELNRMGRRGMLNNLYRNVDIRENEVDTSKVLIVPKRNRMVSDDPNVNRVSNEPIIKMETDEIGENENSPIKKRGIESHGMIDDQANAYDLETQRETYIKSVTKPIVAIFLNFGWRMRYFLNLDDDEHIVVGYCGFALKNPIDSNKKITPNFAKKSIQSLLIYSNLVEKSVRVGEAMTNLLDIVTFGKDINNKKSSLHVYKPLSHKYFDRASVAITDEDGSIISFPENLYTALEIVINPKDL